MRPERGLSTLNHCLEWDKFFLRTRFPTPVSADTFNGLANFLASVLFSGVFRGPRACPAFESEKMTNYNRKVVADIIHAINDDDDHERKLGK